MKQLVFETSSEKSILALIENEEIIAIEKFFGGPGLSEKLAPAVEHLLSKHRFLPDQIGVGIGPGSFTGIRVGASLALSLSFGWNLPLYTAPSTSLFFSKEFLGFAVVFDARSGGFYIQTSIETPPFLLSKEDALERLKQFPGLLSPHADKIQSRLEIPCVEIEPNPLSFFSHAKLHNPEIPLSPIYLDGKTLEWNPAGAIG